MLGCGEETPRGGKLFSGWSFLFRSHLPAGLVPSAVAAPGNKKGGVCPHGAYGLMVGMGAARASSTVM